MKNLKVKANKVSEYIASKGKTKATQQRIDEHMFELFSMGNSLFPHYPWVFQSCSRVQKYKDTVKEQLPFERYTAQFQKNSWDPT